MAEKEVEKIRLEDGRRAERHVLVNDNEKTIEVYAEEPRPLKLENRVIEKTKPVVYERKIQKVDSNGVVLEEIVESAEPQVELKFLEKSVVEGASLGTSSYVTKDELVDVVVRGIKSALEETPRKGMYSEPVMQQQSVIPQDLKEEISERFNSVKKSGWLTPTNIVIAFIFLGQIGLAAYLLLG